MTDEEILALTDRLLQAGGEFLPEDIILLATAARRLLKERNAMADLREDNDALRERLYKLEDFLKRAEAEGRLVGMEASSARPG